MNCHTFGSHRILRPVAAAACIALLIAISPAVVSASSITYPGPFSPPGSGLTFAPVVESSGTDEVPLFGAPHVTVPPGLDFDPVGFVATASGGATDITDGQLNYTLTSLFVNANNKVTIDRITLAEAGDYTLTISTGPGTPNTRVIAGADMAVKVDAVDGVNLPSPVIIPLVSNSLTRSLPGNAGILQPWNLGLTVDIHASLVAQGVIGPNSSSGATKVEVVSDDQLIAQSELLSLAFIAKKDFINTVGSTITGNPFVPEPSTIVLATLGSLALAVGFGYRKNRAAAN